MSSPEPNNVKQSNSVKRDSDVTLSRKVLLKSWNQHAASGTINGHARTGTPYRAVTHMGDFLNRMNPIQDDSGVPLGGSHKTFVSDSSDYVRFKKLRAINQQL
tara:strand:- start:1392 stop:1700 length:309 start_codon:yes stop_codon:yes gene_type:complete